MKPYIHKGDSNYPSIDFDPSKNVFEISGKSLLKDSDPFYEGLFSWFDEYSANPNNITNLVVKLDCFNIASSKSILSLLYKLNDLENNDCNVLISWHYREEDDDMYEVGMDFAFMVKVPFKFVPYQAKDSVLVTL